MAAPGAPHRLPGMSTRDPGTSPRALARTAGMLYLVNIVAGAFAIGYVRATLFVSDPATTADNIQTHEALYRFSLVAHLVVTLTNIPLALIFYELFKVVNRRLALLDVFFTLVATAIEAAGILDQFTPLTLPPGQLPALVSVPASLSTIDYDIYTVFFGFDLICLGYLVLRSTFLPRTIGVLLAVDGLAYLVNSFTDLLTPGFAAQLVPWIQLPALLGEGSLCLWLLVVGLNAERWEAWDGMGWPKLVAHGGHRTRPCAVGRFAMQHSHAVSDPDEEWVRGDADPVGQ
jgi:hypothetical protein